MAIAYHFQKLFHISAPFIIKKIYFVDSKVSLFKKKLKNQVLIYLNLFINLALINFPFTFHHDQGYGFIILILLKKIMTHLYFLIILVHLYLYILELKIPGKLLKLDILFTVFANY